MKCITRRFLGSVIGSVTRQFIGSDERASDPAYSRVVATEASYLRLGVFLFSELNHVKSCLNHGYRMCTCANWNSGHVNYFSISTVQLKLPWKMICLLHFRNYLQAISLIGKMFTLFRATDGIFCFSWKVFKSFWKCIVRAFKSC